MIFKMRTATTDFVELRNGGVNYQTDRNLVEFTMYNLTMLPGACRHDSNIILWGSRFMVSPKDKTLQHRQIFFSFSGRPTDARSELKIRVIFKRDYVYHLSQSFLQSFLMGFLTYLTFWIDISDFPDRFMGSLTCLLVLVTLMSTLAQQLPKTSYYKVSLNWIWFFYLFLYFPKIFAKTGFLVLIWAVSARVGRNFFFHHEDRPSNKGARRL